MQLFHLKARVKEAESKIDNVTNKTPDKPKVAVKGTEPKSKKKNKKDTVEEKRDLQKERAAIKERRAMEKQVGREEVGERGENLGKNRLGWGEEVGETSSLVKKGGVGYQPEKNREKNIEKS